MSKILIKIGNLIEKSPFKVLLTSLAVIAILIAGAVNINMATGNETLVKTSSQAYISNYEMEEEFGGDALMVLLKGNQTELLSQETIEKMWNVEERLKYNEDVYSFISPASIVHQITDKQGQEIKKNLPDIVSGLDKMSKKLIEIGTELGSKNFPDPAEIESKLNELMASMDPNVLMADMLNEQELEMAKMTSDVGTMSSGLNQMGNQLLALGLDLSGKDVPDPEAIGIKLDTLMSQMDADKLAAAMAQEQEDEMAEMETKVGEMSAGLSQMGSKLTEIANRLSQMPSSDTNALESSLAELEGVAKKFDNLIAGQNNLASGIEIIDQVPANLKEIPVNTAANLGAIKSELGTKLASIKNSLPQSPTSGSLNEMSQGLLNMGSQLTNMSDNISNLPTEMARSLGQAPSKMIHELMSGMEKEISEMKSNLSGGLSPEELKIMATGFTSMGEKLKEVSGGIGNLPEKLASMTSGLQDPTVLFAGMMDDIQSEVTEMKSNLVGGMDPEELKTMAAGFVTMGKNLGDLSEGLETFHAKSGMMVSNIPHNQEELDFILYDEDNNLKEIFSDTILDDKHLMMIIKLKGNIEDSDKDAIYEDLSHAMDLEFYNKVDLDDEDAFSISARGEESFDDGEVKYLISGKPVLDSSLRKEMQSNMQIMVVSAALIMFIVLYLVFKVRWRILSIGIILVSVIATLGLMGHLSVSMTMVSMAVFPILIGLGIDFSIQFHNRYEEEHSVTTALAQTGKAISIAVFATMLGFISLYASPVPMIQDFGKMLTIGVVVSFFGSIFLLLPILKVRDRYNPVMDKIKLESSSNQDEGDGVMGRVLRGIAKFVTRFAPFVLMVAIVLASLGLFADSKIGVETDIESFMPQDMAALDDIRYVRDVVGSTDQMVIYMEDDAILDANNITWMQDKADYIENKYPSEIEAVKSIDSLVGNLSNLEDLTYDQYLAVVGDLPESQRAMFINSDETKGAMIINIKHMATEELQDFVENLKQDLEDAPMTVTVTGKSVLDVEMVGGLTDGRIKMTILGIALVFVGLLAVYRNPFKALVPVIPIILIVGMSGGIMYLLGLNYTPITATLGALILGLGTETTILVLERYMEERENGKNRQDAMATTVSRIGSATLSTELTTMGGFSVLIFSSFVILKDFGLMTVINVSLTLISTFTVLPATIWIFDRFIIKEDK